MLTREQLGYTLIIFIALLALGIVISLGPIPQDTSYHLFADTREIWSIPNFWNVVSNIPFAIVGLLGLYRLNAPGKLTVLRQTNTAYILFFSGSLLICFGSCYYHLAPDNHTLLWDRMPMSIAFMALFSIVISEFISLRSGRALLLPLIVAGILSVLYWDFTENSGSGDLRPYILIQFYPILATPVILACFRSRCSYAHAYWWLLSAYIISKVFEYYDADIYHTLGFISGHSLKHLAAALGIYVLLVSYQKRNCRGDSI